MLAFHYNQRGGPEVGIVGNIEKPTPKEGEVLIKVCAASLNPVDFKLRSGTVTNMFSTPVSPTVFGYDVSGIVDECGEEVTEFKKGDPVFADKLSGASDCDFLQNKHIR